MPADGEEEGAVAEEIALVSGADRLRYGSMVGHQLHARRHGYGYHVELAPFEGHRGYWHKIRALERHIEHHEWLVWLDDDAFVTDLDSTFIRDAIVAAEASAAWLVIAPSCPDELNGAWAAYNSGVFALRRSPEARAMLALALDPPMVEIEHWWDRDRLGVFTNGDQDAITWYVEHELGGRGVYLVDPLGWNARPWYYSTSLTDHPVCHFPGHPDKTLSIASFARRMGVDSTLVAGTAYKPPLVDSVSAQVPDASSASVAARTVASHARRIRKRVIRKVDWIRETKRWS